MRALEQEVQDAVFDTIEPMLPKAKTHPLGCHRPRKSDRLCFRGLWLRLVTGSAWETIEFMLEYQVSDTTLRTRRDQWIKAGVFDELFEHALHAYDRIIGLDLDDVCIDGSNHKAPCGGEGTGINPFDRGKLGWKWCMAVDTKGIPVSWVLDGANCHDFKLLQPTLDTLVNNGLIHDLNTLHLDRGFSYKNATPRAIAPYNIPNLDMQPKQPRGQANQLIGLGARWIVESANSWLTNYGQLRRNTDKHTRHRHAALCLATTILLTGRLINHRNTHHQNPPIR